MPTMKTAARERIPLERQQIFYFPQASVTNGQTLAQANGGTANQYPILRAGGMKHLRAVFSCAQTAASGFPRVAFYMGPNDTVASPFAVYTFTLDSGQSGTVYVIDCPLITPYFSIQLTQGGSSGNVFGIGWVYPEDPNGIDTIIPGAATFVKDAPLTPLGYGQGTVDGTTAKSLATLIGTAIPAGSRYVFLQTDQGGTGVTCRWRDDGTAPTAAVGFPLIQGVFFPYEGTLSAFQIIGTGAGPTTVNCSFYS